jgi:hypothetical protein
MKKLKVILAFLLVLVIVIGIGAVVLPYHTYYLALTEGIQNDYLDLPRYPDMYFKGKTVNAIEQQNNQNDQNINTEQWRRFPFVNYSVPLPYQNPLFVFVPDFKFIDGKERTGFNLLSNQGKFYINFMMGGVYKFKVNYQTDWIFRLPYFSKHIRKKKSTELWSDILTKKITFPERGNLGFIDYLFKIKNLDLHQMVYNVFILKSRKLFLPEEVQDFALYEENDLAIVKLKPRYGGTTLEKIYLYRDGELYTYYLETSLNQSISKYLRWNYIRNVEYHDNPPEKAIGIYALFRKLEYNQKTGQEGLIHLFSSWSVDQEKSEFMKEMVQYLERGPNTNIVYLKPLYRYSLKHFKTTFSQRDERLLESEKLRKQRLKEEAARKLDRATILNEADRYEKQSEKAKVMLQKAKDHRRDMKSQSPDSNIDEEEGMLEID